MTAANSGSYAASGEPGHQAPSASVGELVGQVSRDLSTLMRQELELAKAELKQEAVKSGKAAGMFGGAGFAGYMVIFFASVALWEALGLVMSLGWAALVVAAIWAVAGAVLYAAGRSQLRKLHPVPQRTAETLQELPGALKSR